ncbi:MAG: hypothetical protein Tsb0021_12170 [Chlamydiales bacterium]
MITSSIHSDQLLPLKTYIKSDIARKETCNILGGTLAGASTATILTLSVKELALTGFIVGAVFSTMRLHALALKVSKVKWFDHDGRHFAYVIHHEKLQECISMLRFLPICIGIAFETVPFSFGIYFVASIVNLVAWNFFETITDFVTETVFLGIGYSDYLES